MLRSPWSGAPVQGRVVRIVAVGATAACVLAATAWTATPGYADATSPKCPTPGIDSGTIAPAPPGVLVNAGVPAVTVKGRTTGACGWSADSSLHFWAADPSWFAAPTSPELGASPVSAGHVDIAKIEATG